MSDFLKKIFSQAKDKNISKVDAVNFLCEYEKNEKSIRLKKLHPLLHQNTSTLSEQRFSSTFSGEEFFLKDHVINGQRILPGVAYLEMANAAILKAREANRDQVLDVQLKNIVWVQPISVGEQSLTIHIGLHLESNSRISYEIYSEQQGINSDRKIYGQGQAVIDSAITAPILNINKLKTECGSRRLGAEYFYNIFNTLSMDYGPGFRGIQEIFVGEGKLLSRLSLPSSVCFSASEYIIHPSLLDSALQSSIGLSFAGEVEIGEVEVGEVEVGEKIGNKPLLPFALEELNVFYPCENEMWAYVRYSPGSGSDRKVQRLDIDLCDKNGRICVALRGFTSRVFDSEASVNTAGDVHGSLIFQPQWRVQPIRSSIEKRSWGEHLIILCESLDEWQESLNTQLHFQGENTQYLSLYCDKTDIDQRYEYYSLQLLEKLQEILGGKPESPVLVQLVVPYRFPIEEDEKSLFSGLFGLLRCASQENSKLTCQLIEVEIRCEVRDLTNQVVENYAAPMDIYIRYQEGKRWVCGWKEIAPVESLNGSAESLPWKDGGVYLITGGVGGLAVLFANEIANKTNNVKLILIGRSSLSEEKDAQLCMLRNVGALAEYRPVDLGDKAAVVTLVENIKADFGEINGIIHSAGVKRDNFILNKTRNELKEVFTPKVTGLVNLDYACRNVNLDFFVLFSSMSVLGNIGQADYAAANAFMDAYAYYRNSLVRKGRRQGYTLSINWPLWKEGGMKMDIDSERLMQQRTGMVPMHSMNGIQALYQALSIGLSQALVVEGDIQRIKRNVLAIGNPPSAIVKKIEESKPIYNTNVDSVDSHSEQSIFLSDVQGKLASAIAELLMVDIDMVDSDEELSGFGFDSITLTQLANKLNHDYDLTLSPALFFEYSTVRQLAEYLINEYPKIFAKQLTAAVKDDNSVSSINGKTENTIISDQDALLTGVQTSVAESISELLQVDIEMVDVHEELSAFGFDSITLTQLANRLNQKYSLTLSPALFFEYSTVYELSNYLINECPNVFVEKKPIYRSVESSQSAEKLVVESVREKRPLKPSRMSFSTDTSPTKIMSTVNKEKTLLPNASMVKAEPIAIIGMSGCFPNSPDLDAFWENLAEGNDCISEIPEDRWSWKEYYGDPKKEENKTNIKWGGFIEGVGEFDPLFFGISPLEAQLMDPQQRLLMTYTWKVIEDAGYSPQSLSGTNTAIIVGTGSTGYDRLVAQENTAIEGYSATGAVPSVGPNRMSYFLNLHGPSEPIETACSSSLVAIHRAVQVIENNNCEMAIVGGVNTIVIPDYHISFNKAGMLCEDGRCKTFSNRANGYVRGEGVGMLFLKKLSKAEQDGDHIYALVRGSAENHGGKASSLTAPNPKAQAELLKAAYTKAGIDPRSVSYIEAHGTGTSLGDPIEINALKGAFKSLYKTAGYEDVGKAHCALGSVKTNIGHLELAAGIAGVIKVLLQIKHKTLVKTLHCDVTNPYFDLKGTPFYIIQQTGTWDAPRDDQGNIFPRRAGISSFGFGGVNAHVIIEEYISEEESSSGLLSKKSLEQHVSKSHLIVLSARSEETLRELVRNLKEFIVGNRDFAANHFQDIAYTLQVGRDAMDERLAIAVSSIDEMEAKLQSFLDSKTESGSVHRGQVKYHKDALSIFTADEDITKTVDAWINKGKYAKLLDLWVKGLNIEWEKLYNDSNPRRIALPTYPFAKERYWVAVDKKSERERKKDKRDFITKLHPLVHQNASTLYEQRFSSTFSGEEFFLADHKVNNQMVLPGVTYLEMVREAVAQATETNRDSTDVSVQLNNMVWAHPIVVGKQPQDVYISLYPKEGDQIAFEICSKSISVSGETTTVVHSEGRAKLVPTAEVPVLDLNSLHNNCKQRQMSAQQFYERIEAMGFGAGARFRGLENLWIGNKQVFAKLSLPRSVPKTVDSKQDYFLHPTLMDSSLQSALALAMEDDFITKPLLPFALDELRVLGPYTPVMWASVRGLRKGASDQRVQCVDIDICNDKGQVCVQLKGLTSRILEEGSSEVATQGCLIMEPYWKQKGTETDISSPKLAEHHVILCEPINDWQLEIDKKLSAQENRVHCLSLVSERTEVDLRYIDYVAQVFEKLQSIIRSKPKMPVLIQVVVPCPSAKEDKSLFSGLSGLLKTAQLENPKLIGQLIEVDTQSTSDKVVDQLLENRNAPSHHVIRYQNGKRWLGEWREVINTSMQEENLITPSWKDKGVYLITGGASGLGLLFANDIVQKTKDAVVVLTGRSSLDEDKLIQIKNLEDKGANVDYRQVDVADEVAVVALIDSLQSNYGRVNGIIHSAGVIRDNFILKKTQEELIEVLAPKVTGLVNLDRATKAMPLDFLVVFSSLSGVLGNTGQADYAAANAFMDAYVHYRNYLVAEGQRQGRTVSIDWPLWRDGSMSMDAQSEQDMQRNTGMEAMATETGLQALYQAIASEASQYLVMEGDIKRMRLFIQKRSRTDAMSLLPSTTPLGATMVFTAKESSQNSNSDNNFSTSSDASQGVQQEKVADYLKNILSSVIEVPAQRINIDDPLEKYGINSIMVVKLTNKLEEIFGSLSKTLFFEYQTISELSRYFLDSYTEKLSEILGADRVIAETKIYHRARDDSNGNLGIINIPVVAQDIQRSEVVEYIKGILSSVIEVPSQRISADEPLEKYGIDSIMVVKLTNELEKTFGSLSKTLFFEYQTISELSEYFLEFHADELSSLLGLNKSVEEIKAVSGTQLSSVIESSISKNKKIQRFSLRSNVGQQDIMSSCEGIAIIGMSGRYPKADNLEEFWQILKEGRDCITEIPKDRWDHSLYFDEDKGKPGKTNSKWGGFINDVDKFDPLYFSISPREAELMEPMERLFMQCAIHAIQDAGYTPAALEHDNGKESPDGVGVFVGAGLEEYQLYGVQERQQGNSNALLGCSAFISNRVSYFCNFSGPSFTVDTMCSSSLTAIHLACQSLYRKECGAALAGGVNISIHPNKYLFLGQGGFVSSKGRCQSFGIGGDGYVSAEGVGAVLLKPLSKAVADGDHIYGVIKGSAINHGGKTNGLTVPNPNAQARVIKRAFEAAGVNPRTISYLEAHGTGTSLGDPIEITGLSKSFKDSTQDIQFCAIGSVKSNIGHCEAAAGISGLTKVLLQLKHKQLVPSLHSETLSPNIDFEMTPFVVQQKLADWEQPEIEIDGITKRYPRIAGISSFGAGGSNAHIVVEEYIAPERVPNSLNNKPAIVLLSAKNQERLKEYIQNMSEYLEKNQDIDLVSLAYTLQVGREAMDERIAIITNSIEGLMEKLRAYQAGKRHIENVYQGRLKENKNTLEIFANDNTFQQTLAGWMHQEQYRKLADLWAKGLMIDWSQLYGEYKHQRISLPTYPFAKESYWIPTFNTQSTASGSPEKRKARLFNEKSYEQVFDEVLGKKISADAAVTLIKSKIFYSSM